MKAVYKDEAEVVVVKQTRQLEQDGSLEAKMRADDLH